MLLSRMLSAMRRQGTKTGPRYWVGKISRAIFFMDNNTMVLVSGFIKKTNKTPKAELELSRKRKNEYER